MNFLINKQRVILLFLFASISNSTLLYSQTKYNEIGIHTGISYYIGELNPQKHFKNINLSYGLSYTHNFNSRFAWKQFLNFTKLQGDDKSSNINFNQNRNLSFYTSIQEFSSTIDFNFFKLGYDDKSKKITPFMFFGIGFFYINPKTKINGNIYKLSLYKTENKNYSNLQFMFPFGAGIKWFLNKNILINFDAGIRKTYTDYIDDISTAYPNDPNKLDITTIKLSNPSNNNNNWGKQRGNPSNKDWFFNYQISIHINFIKQKLCRVYSK